MSGRRLSREFGNVRGQGDAAEAKRNLEYTLSRARPKELAHEYLDLDTGTHKPAAAEEQEDNSPDAIQARAREAWAAYRARDQQSGASPEEIQRLARERWQEYREAQQADRASLPHENSRDANSQDRSQGKDDDQGL